MTDIDVISDDPEERLQQYLQTKTGDDWVAGRDVQPPSQTQAELNRLAQEAHYEWVTGEPYTAP